MFLINTELARVSLFLWQQKGSKCNIKVCPSAQMCKPFSWLHLNHVCYQSSHWSKQVAWPSSASLWKRITYGYRHQEGEAFVTASATWLLKFKQAFKVFHGEADQACFFSTLLPVYFPPPGALFTYLWTLSNVTSYWSLMSKLGGIVRHGTSRSVIAVQAASSLTRSNIFKEFCLCLAHFHILVASSI